MTMTISMMKGGMITVMTKQRKRQSHIMAVADEVRYDSMDGQGLDPKNYTKEQLTEVIEDCTGFILTDIEYRLAVVTFEEGTRAAKKCVWYT
jgi:hypothetical protein